MTPDLDALLAVGSYPEPAGGGVEEQLPAGDVTEGVVKVGGAVRRPRQRQSGAVAAYLRHLEASGFVGAPRFLGTDVRGRDVLDHLSGDTAGTPPEDWIADDAWLTQIGALLAQLHAASHGFQAPGEVTFFRDLMPDPPELASLVDAPTIVGHNDITPQNVVIADGLVIGLIDFDLAGPTTPAREIANAALHWAPIGDPEDRTPALRDVDPLHRTRLLADGYRLGREDRAALADVRLRASLVGWERMRLAAETLGGGWARMWDEGVGDVIKRRQRWLTEHGDALTAALLR